MEHTTQKLCPIIYIEQRGLMNENGQSKEYYL